MPDTGGVEELINQCHAALSPRLQQLPVMLKRYPPLTAFAVIFALISALPLLVFVCFAFGTFIVMLVGFLLVEGTLLAFGICILMSALFFTAVAALGISATFWVLGFLASNWRELLNECHRYVDSQLAKHLAVEEAEKR